MFIFIWITRSNLIINPIVREHVFAILSIYLLKFKYDINVKPRMLNWLTLSISTPSVVNVSSSTYLLGIWKILFY